MLYKFIAFCNQVANKYIARTSFPQYKTNHRMHISIFVLPMSYIHKYICSTEWKLYIGNKSLLECKLKWQHKRCRKLYMKHMLFIEIGFLITITLKARGIMNTTPIFFPIKSLLDMQVNEIQINFGIHYRIMTFNNILSLLTILITGRDCPVLLSVSNERNTLTKNSALDPYVVYDTLSRKILYTDKH